MLIIPKNLQKSIDHVNGLLKQTSKEKIEIIKKNAKIDDCMEYVQYQNIQSRAFAIGLIDKNTALWIYNMLKGFNKRALSHRVVCLELIMLLAKRLKEKTNPLI